MLMHIWQTLLAMIDVVNEEMFRFQSSRSQFLILYQESLTFFSCQRDLLLSMKRAESFETKVIPFNS